MSKTLSMRLRTISLICMGVVAGTLGTLQIQAIARSGASLPLEEMQQFASVYSVIKSRYVEAADEKKLVSDAIGGMVSGLDAHSQYMDKKTYKEFLEGHTGKFGGVGMEVNLDESGLLRVVTPIEDTPAFRAGLQTGDLISKIDNTLVKGLRQDEAVRQLRGDPGTKVQIVVFRKSENRTFTVDLVRSVINIKAVRSKLVEPGYGYVRISSFQDKVLEEFVSQVTELYKKERNLKGIVLDLRNDPGGSLDGAIGVSAAFLPKDAVVVSTKGQTADSQAVFKASREFYQRSSGDDLLARLPAELKKVPLVVLVNEASASASEIVAAALQDHKRATIMGSQTFGKGSVQTLHTLGGGAAIKLTTARYYSPSERTIQTRGVIPDVLLDETAEGNITSALRMREADLEKHLNADKGTAGSAQDAAREKAREEAKKRWDAEQAKPLAERRKVPEFGSVEDFQLGQALNQLKGKPVMAAAQAAAERKAN